MEDNYDIEFYKKFRKFVKSFMHVCYDIESTGVITGTNKTIPL